MITPAYALDWTTGVAQPGIDVVRAGVATFIGSNGLIQSASADTQRIDYTTSAAGLLVEESRTNSMLHSEDFSSWTRTNVTVSTNAIDAPDGNKTADKLINNSGVTGSGAFNGNGAYRNASVTAGSRITVSVFAKAAEKSIVGVSIASSDFGSGGATCSFNLSTLAITPNANCTGRIVSLINGYYRCILTTNSTSPTTTSPRVYVYNPELGNGSDGIYVWGCQVENGTDATSYIPTTSATVTRNADVATITGTNFSDFWQATRGGVLARARPGTVSGVRPWLQFDDGTANEIIALRGNTTNPELYIVDGGTPQAQIDAGTIAANTDYSMTAWWQTNDCKARLNNGAVFTDTSATIPTVTQARLGSDGTNYLNGHLASIDYYNQFTGNQIYTRRKNKVFSFLL